MQVDRKGNLSMFDDDNEDDFSDDCQMTDDGTCMKAGTEECDECWMWEDDGVDGDMLKPTTNTMPNFNDGHSN